MTSMANITNNKPPPRYIIHFTHSGAVCWDDDGGGGGDTDRDGDGDDDEAGGAGAGGGDDTELSGSGGDSVVKAPTALQAPLVSELIALTFQ